MEDMVTIIITTSPSPVHPSLELIDAVLTSISTCAAELLPCRLILVCDGFKAAKKNAFRSGKVDAAAITTYKEYKERLRALTAGLRGGQGDTEDGGAVGAPPAPGSGLFPRIEMLELTKNHGFGFAVRRALAEVATPLVCVIQHDRTFLRAVDVGAVVTALVESSGAAGYVLMPTRSTANYVHLQRSKLGEHGIKEVSHMGRRTGGVWWWLTVRQAVSSRLTPVCAWRQLVYRCALLCAAIRE